MEQPRCKFELPYHLRPNLRTFPVTFVPLAFILGVLNRFAPPESLAPKNVLASRRPDGLRGALLLRRSKNQRLESGFVGMSAGPWESPLRKERQSAPLLLTSFGLFIMKYGRLNEPTQNQRDLT